MDKEEARQVVEAAIAKGLAKKPDETIQEVQAEKETRPQLEKYIDQFKEEDKAKELAVATVTPAQAPSSPIGMELEVSATTPLEMAQCQDGLIAWCGRKVEAMKREAAELAENLAIAIKNKWKTNTLKRHADLAAKRVTFYEKIKAALEAGYCIVPNFPVTLFAIRTDRAKPATMFTCTEHYGKPHYAKAQDAKLLTVGEGEYQNPNPVVEEIHTDTVTDERKNTKQVWTSEAVDWDDIDFPINMAKPIIMEATAQAMKKKIFDELGILPDPHPKKDPLIVGRILDPRPTGYSQQKFVTFIVAWHLNVRDL